MDVFIKSVGEPKITYKNRVAFPRIIVWIPDARRVSENPEGIRAGVDGLSGGYGVGGHKDPPGCPKDFQNMDGQRGSLTKISTKNPNIEHIYLKILASNSQLDNKVYNML